MVSRIEIRDKNVLVTGGASGIGKEIVKALAPNNNVYALDKDAGKLEELRKEFPKIKVIPADLTDWDGTRAALEKNLPELVHCLVNNAGIGGQGGFLSVTENELDIVLAVNTRAIVNVSQIFANKIIQHNEGREENRKVIGSIVNLASLASRFPTRISTAYNVSKAAVDMLTKAMALELGPLNIRVNSVNPNIVMTELAEAWMKASAPQLKEKLIARTPLGRCVDIMDVVNTVIFLLWDQVVMIHGESVFVDGGYSVS